MQHCWNVEKQFNHINHFSLCSIVFHEQRTIHFRKYMAEYNLDFIAFSHTMSSTNFIPLKMFQSSSILLVAHKWLFCLLHVICIRNMYRNHYAVHLQSVLCTHSLSRATMLSPLNSNRCIHAHQVRCNGCTCKQFSFGIYFGQILSAFKKKLE